MFQVGKFSGNSYIRYPGLGDSALLWLSLEVKVKPEKEDGVLLYNADRYQADTGDFLAVVLADGYVEVVLEDGSGVLVCRGEERLELGVWHTVLVVREGGQVSLTVDSQAPVITSQATHHPLSLQQSLWLGGLQDTISLPASLAHLASRGLVGCVTDLTINSLPVQLLYSAVATVNLDTCQEIPEIVTRTVKKTLSDHTIPAFSGHSYLAFNSSDIYTK